LADLAVEFDEGVLRLTVEREAKRNSLTVEALNGIVQAVRGYGSSDQARMVIVSTAGTRVFSSGADLGVMDTDATLYESHRARSVMKDVLVAFRSCPVPVLVKVQGLCLAGGMALVLGGDVALASDAAMFGLPEVSLGLWPFMVSALLARHVSPKHALDLMLTGDRIGAEAAYQIGLVSRVFPAATFEEDAETYALKIAAAAPVAVRMGKAAWAMAQQQDFESALEALCSQLSLLTTTRDAAEGIRAFFEKRPPRYAGS
jgi:enoyl-CoA hydratase/carnithine racemase